MKSDIVKELLSVIGDFDVISFDVFDTLLLRPVCAPTDVFEIVERDTGMKGFARARRNAECSLSKATKSERHPNGLLPEIYSGLSKYRNCCECETATEKRLLTANPEMLEVFNEAKALKKKVVLITDMYLPSDFIRSVLKENGVEGWDDLFLSCEQGASKSSGLLYEIAIEQLGIDPSRILHIGDNFHSDYLMAMKQGIVAYYYEGVLSKFKREHSFVGVALKENDSLEMRRLVGAVAVASHCYMHNTREGGGGYWPELSCLIFSVIGYSYVRYVIEDAKMRGVDTLLLLARDGWLLEKIVNLVSPSTKTKYIYAPRRDYLAVSQDITSNNRRQFILLLKEHIGDEKFAAVKTDADAFENGAPPSDNLRDAMDAFSSYVDNEYKRYLQSIGLGNKPKMGLVDITSSHGSAHRFLQRYFTSPIHAYYYFCATDKNRRSGWDFPDSSSFITGQTSSCIDQGVVEYVFSAPTPPIAHVRDCAPQYETTKSFYYDYKSRVVKTAKEPVLYCCSLFDKWGLKIDAKCLTDWKEAFFGKISTTSWDISHFSFVKEYYGVSNQLEHLPIRTARRYGRPLLTIRGHVLVSVESRIHAMRKYSVFKLFGKWAFLKVRRKF